MRSASEPVFGMGLPGGATPVPSVLLANGIGSAGGGGRSGRTVPVALPTDGSISASTRRGRSRPGGLCRPRFASPARDVIDVAAAFRVVARVLGFRVARFAPLACGVFGVAFAVRVVAGVLRVRGARFAALARGVFGVAFAVKVVAEVLRFRAARFARAPLRVAVAFRAVVRVFVFRVARFAGGFSVGRERLADARGIAFDRGPDFANEVSFEI